MISVIVPIFKVEKYLEKCIQSIVYQSYKNLEIILVDDGSPDNCPDICDKWAKIDSRIKVLHQQNKGLIEARKSGVRIAKGDYITFVDGDDWVEYDMYSEVANAIEKYNSDAVITQFYYSYPDKETPSEYLLEEKLYNRENIEKEIFPTMLFKAPFYSFGIYPNCWTKVFKAEILKKHIFSVDSKIRMGEDIAFTYPCLMECDSIAFINKPLYHYIINPESMTKKYDPVLHKIYLLPYEQLKIKSRELEVDLGEQLKYYLLYLVNFVIRNEASTSNDKSKKERNEILEDIINVTRDNIDSINLSYLPLHTKALYLILKLRSKFLIKLYMKLLRKFI